MRRFYEDVIAEHFRTRRQMLFLVGPRQVGKTTLARVALSGSKRATYLNWDDDADRRLISRGAEAVAEKLGLDRLGDTKARLAIDELHKYPRWKRSLKGFFDKYERECEILVTGSARLDIFRKGGDSLLGRYFQYRVHPLTLSELLGRGAAGRGADQLILAPKGSSAPDLNSLLRLGGFPEPFLKGEERFLRQWRRAKAERLFREDLRDATRIQELAQLRLMAEIIEGSAGRQATVARIGQEIGVAYDTAKRWLGTLESFYYCFSVRPWSRNVRRSLIKEPKVYLWDWSCIQDPGARFENLVASHLLKSVHFWNDAGLGDFGLYYLRDKEKREVDFLVSRDGRPWFLVEAKAGRSATLSPSLALFQAQTGAAHAFQAMGDLPYVDRDCFTSKHPILVPAVTLLSQLR